MRNSWRVVAPAVLLALAAGWLSGWREDFAVRDAAAQREAGAAIDRIMAGKADTVWPLLRHSQDPAVRSYLIKAVLAQLEKETDVTVKRALVLALGESRAEFLPPETRSKLVPVLLQWYRSDPDPGRWTGSRRRSRRNRESQNPKKRTEAL